MSSLTQLEVRSPDGNRFAVALEKERLTVGRLAELNDIALEPDPQQLVSRRAHCVLEREHGMWWVADSGSLNGTFLRRGVALEPVEGRAALRDGDVICLLARVPDAGEPSFWQLHFADPLATYRAAPVMPRARCLAYDRPQERLFLVEAGEPRPIALRPQEHRLVRHMAQRNADAGNAPVLCSHEELMAAVWDDEPLHRRDELTRLVWDLRHKIEVDPAQPRLLETEPRRGYRLRTCP